MQETLKANPYVYADNDPVNEIDPSGKFTISGGCLGAISASVLTGGLGVFLLTKFGSVQVVGAFFGALIAAGPAGWFALGSTILVGGLISYDAFAAIWNNTIAPACGWGNLSPLNITISF